MRYIEIRGEFDEQDNLRHFVRTWVRFFGLWVTEERDGATVELAERNSTLAVNDRIRQLRRILSR